VSEASVRDGARSALIVATARYDDPALRGLRGASADADALEQVLSDPEIGGFDIRTVIDQPAHVVAEAVEEFFADRAPQDLLVVHFSGHGIKNQDGELHFAASNTKVARLGSTAIAAQFVNRQMNASRSRRIVLLLDCCYAGAFDRGMAARAVRDLDIQERFGGRGRAVITASGALEYAFEGNQLAEDRNPEPSMFTSAMVRGLLTGEADRNQDGGSAWTSSTSTSTTPSVKSLRTRRPASGPSAWRVTSTWLDAGAQSPRRHHSRGNSSSPSRALLAGVRSGAVQELVRLVNGHHQGLALGARLALERLADDDSRAVATAATAAIADLHAAAERELASAGTTERTPDDTPAGAADQIKAASAPSRESPAQSEPVPGTHNRPALAPRRRTLIAVATVVMLLRGAWPGRMATVAGGHDSSRHGWPLDRRDTRLR
jgi:hypothetical protein